ncbi:MAG: hypothetical protein Hals2KO_40320 [Halioglobus sp.]
MAQDLKTTEFAVLGLLARRPWSAYELTQYMRTSNIRAIWPRAESRLYEAPKKLARLGYASTETAKVGKRSRTVYTISQKGMEALTTWMEQDSRPFGFEYEALLKLALGDVGDSRQRVSQLATLKRQSDEDWATLTTFFQQFAAGDFDEASADRQVQNLLVNSFIRELLDARRRWSEVAAEVNAQYSACSTEAEKSAMVRRFYAERLHSDTPQGDGDG